MELAERIRESNGTTTFHQPLFEYTVNNLLKAFKSGWDTPASVQLTDLGITYGQIDPAIISAYEMNVFRFSAAKTMAEVQALNELFRESSDSQEFFSKAIKQMEVFNKQWLETEYNTALLVGESAATYHRLMAKKDLFPYWEYRTQGDEHVREHHLAIHGLVLPYNDPLWAELFPPNGWNCRCFILPRMKSEVDRSTFDAMRKRAQNFIKSTVFQKSKAQGWGVNRGSIGEIFTANQMYVYKQPGLSSRLLMKLKPSDYGLPSYSKAKKIATEPSPIYTESPAEFYNSLEVLPTGGTVIRDWKNRPLTVEPRNFQRHVTKKDDRVKLLSAAQQTLRQPDEVWINGKAQEDMVYIKYYQDQTLVAIGEIKKGNVVQLSTWFALKEKAETINKYRRGILVKNPER